MKETLMGALAGVLLLCTACASNPGAVQVTNTVTVERFDCEGYASMTIVGDVHLTAAHVVDGCPGAANALVFNKRDLAILETGSGTLPTCREPDLNEPLVIIGYPGLDRGGKPKMGMKQRDVEYTIGLYNHDWDVLPIIGKRGIPEFIEDLGMMRAKDVMPGTSGGAVISLVNGDFLGVVSATALNGSFAFFVTAPTICKALEGAA